jgi:hypothetical protein
MLPRMMANATRFFTMARLTDLMISTCGLKDEFTGVRAGATPICGVRPFYFTPSQEALLSTAARESSLLVLVLYQSVLPFQVSLSFDVLLEAIP